MSSRTQFLGLSIVTMLFITGCGQDETKVPNQKNNAGAGADAQKVQQTSTAQPANGNTSNATNTSNTANKTTTAQVPSTPPVQNGNNNAANNAANNASPVAPNGQLDLNKIVALLNDPAAKNAINNIDVNKIVDAAQGAGEVSNSDINNILNKYGLDSTLGGFDTLGSQDGCPSRTPTTRRPR